MFTGIVAEQGRSRPSTPATDGVRLKVSGGPRLRARAGDSVSVNGACLTAAAADDGSFEADVMNQTLGLTTLGGLAEGDPVNLELALRADDRLGGHVVQGHVDGTGPCRLGRRGLRPPPALRACPTTCCRYVVERGSIAVEGVSLTVSALAPAGDWLRSR